MSNLVKTWVMWNWNKDIDAPRSWEPGEHVVLVKLQGEVPIGASEDSMGKLADRALLRFADRGGVVVVVYDLAAFRRRAGDTFHDRIVPALVVERQVRLTPEIDAIFASMTAKHRALLVTPREPIDIDRPTCPTCRGHDHSEAALEETGMFFCKEHDEEMTFGALLDPCAGANRHGVDLVIARGTSGKKAWPLHPEWIRDMSDACHEHDVAFTFLGWGDWVPRSYAAHQALPEAGPGDVVCLRRDGQQHPLDSVDQEGVAWMQKVGASRSGRLLVEEPLDGVEGGSAIAREHLDLPLELRSTTVATEA